MAWGWVGGELLEGGGVIMVGVGGGGCYKGCVCKGRGL